MLRDPALPPAVRACWRSDSNAAKLARMHALWQRRCSAVACAVMVISFSFIWVLGALLDAFDCFTAPDGASQLRSDPKTLCTSATHARFRRFAAALVAAIGLGVPCALALWLRHLQNAALADGTLLRPAWRGLADPATRGAWGCVFETVRCE